MTLQQLNVIISGGGTGGHIFPAIAIANAIKKERPATEFLFIGAKGKMEMEKVPAAGYKIEGLWISGIQRQLTVDNLSFPLKLASSLWKANKLLRKFKPDVVIGTGGFASGPILQVATWHGIPTLIQEQNSFAGITNKLLAKRADAICVAYEGMEKFFPKEKIIITGNPVRENVVDISNKKEKAYAHFGLQENKKTVLVIGGSLGAKTINESIPQCLDKLAEEDIQLIWQTGKGYYETAVAQLAPYATKNIQAHAFLQDMDYAYAVADIVISRAGASSVSELSLVKKPCILIPSPNVAEDHQTKNAMALVNKNATILVKDKDAKTELSEALFSLLNNDEKRNELSRNIATMALRDSATVIAQKVLELTQ